MEKMLFSISSKYNKIGVGKEIKIVFSKVEHLHNELGHYVKVIVLMSFNNSFCYK
jgi:hypothetical protein